jgi:hypothetical protein
MYNISEVKRNGKLRWNEMEEELRETECKRFFFQKLKPAGKASLMYVKRNYKRLMYIYKIEN